MHKDVAYFSAQPYTCHVRRYPAILLVLLASCGFPGNTATSDGALGVLDGKIDSASKDAALPDGPASDAAPQGFAVAHLPAIQVPSGTDVAINNSASIDTTALTLNDGNSNSQRLTVLTQTDGGEVAVLTARNFVINGEGALTVTGIRPLIVVAETARIEGRLLASAVRNLSGPGAVVGGDNANGGDGALAGNADSGSGGGGGGTNGGNGGDGRSGNETAQGAKGGKAQSATITTLVGGGRGGNNSRTTTGCTTVLPGGGGGAIQISVRTTLTISGTIAANGGGGRGGDNCGGSTTGGAGGGAGGAIYLQAPSIQVASTAVIVANGGGGGGGGVFVAGQPAAVGGDGSDGLLSTLPAPGGLPASVGGSAGGTGGGLVQPANGGLAANGGGGGGAAGRIVTTSTAAVAVGATISPSIRRL